MNSRGVPAQVAAAHAIDGEALDGHMGRSHSNHAAMTGADKGHLALGKKGQGSIEEEVASIGAGLNREDRTRDRLVHE